MKRSILVAFALLTGALAFGQQFKVLHSFGGYPNDGASSFADVVFDNAGNLYGTTSYGGSNGSTGCDVYGCGVVFRLSPNPDGSWTETVLYNFCSNSSGALCLDGADPSAGLTLDATGNLYGTAWIGGANCFPNGCGVVYELSPPGASGGPWTETVLHNFCSDSQALQCRDGAYPSSQLVFDSAGNLYGTASSGGNGHHDGGVVFELSPGSGGWTETVLYSFCSLGQGSFCPDGAYPNAGLTFDAAGNLYGTTETGGTEAGAGTVFRLSPSAAGWKEAVLLAFRSTSEGFPVGTVTFDAQGNLYSTFSSAPFGGVFRLNRKARSENVFMFDGSDGSLPFAGVYVDTSAGDVYGTTSGNAGWPGNIFRIGRNGKETVLHPFCSLTNCADGESPQSSLVPDKAGNLYGTTELGGVCGGDPYGCGVVFEITP